MKEVTSWEIKSVWWVMDSPKAKRSSFLPLTSNCQRTRKRLLEKSIKPLLCSMHISKSFDPSIIPIALWLGSIHHWASSFSGSKAIRQVGGTIYSAFLLFISNSANLNCRFKQLLNFISSSSFCLSITWNWLNIIHLSPTSYSLVSQTVSEMDWMVRDMM